MLPNATLGKADGVLNTVSLGNGIFVVTNAYESEYDFFSPSSVFPSKSGAIEPTENDSSVTGLTVDSVQDLGIR